MINRNKKDIIDLLVLITAWKEHCLLRMEKGIFLLSTAKPVRR
jgi:hypothetical protein